MRRSLHAAVLSLACATLAPACLLSSGPFDTGGGGSGAGLPTGGGGSGGQNTAGSGGDAPGCGDGVLAGGESCDDGNGNNGDGCSASCGVEVGWVCAGDEGEKSTCVECGDGEVGAPIEQCDDGNSDNGDGCSKACVKEMGWTCDGTPTVCTPLCGDGMRVGDEACDDGDTDAGDGCSGACAVEPGWICGNEGPDVCNETCGDGMIVGMETCDDGDPDDGNGCTENCLGVLDGWTCNPAMPGPGSCTTNCGDGFVAGDEKCEDGNESNNDGCSELCELEASCGNGKIEPGEECEGANGCVGCKLVNPVGTCAALLDINALSAPSMDGTAILHVLDGDTTMMPILSTFGDPTTFEVPTCAPANESIHNTKVHKYLTGPTGSMITIEALDKNTANEPTFDKSVVWVSLDCLDPTKIDGCNDDGGAGERSLLQLGYVPPKTTLYIAIAGNGDMADGAGKYSLKVTEQPVKLFFSTTFAGGLSPFTASDSGSDNFTWAQCELNCPGSPNNYTFSRSGKEYALAADEPMNHDLLNETMRTGPIGVGNAANVFFQFNVDFKQSNAVFSWDDSGDGSTWKKLDTETLFEAAGRRIQNVSADVMSSNIHVGFTYDDNGLDTKFTQVDDVYVYGF